jgi:hypothetical protein
MEPLNLMVTLSLVADDVRHEVTGRGTGPGRNLPAPKKQRITRRWRALFTRQPRCEVHPPHATVLR